VVWAVKTPKVEELRRVQPRDRVLWAVLALQADQALQAGQASQAGK